MTFTVGDHGNSRGASTTFRQDDVMDSEVDRRVVVAAQNNADWYAMMFDIRGLRYERTAEVFRALDPPPPFHSTMTVVEPDLSAETVALIEREAQEPSFGIKDSFCRLDLPALRLKALFDASWIWIDRPSEVDTSRWIRIDTPELLVAWESAWRGGGSPREERQFPPPILERDDVVIFGRTSSDGFDAGVIVNQSEHSVGISNLFGAEVFEAAASLASTVDAAHPIVGYERGDALRDAVAAGFENVGPLRVCTRYARV